MPKEAAVAALPMPVRNGPAVEDEDEVDVEEAVVLEAAIVIAEEDEDAEADTEEALVEGEAADTEAGLAEFNDVVELALLVLPPDKRC